MSGFLEALHSEASGRDLSITDMRGSIDLFFFSLDNTIAANSRGDSDVPWQV